MQIRKGYKYRLKTNRGATAQFVRFAGACRFVWNKILSINEHRYFSGVPRLSYAQACELVAWWKQSEDYGWLSHVHSQVLQQCLKDLDRAYAHCFAGRTAPPQYRKKFLSDSFRYPQGFKIDGRRVYLPMVGWCEFWHSRDIDGTVKNVTISRHGKHWFVAFQVEMEVGAPVHPAPGADVGIDLGIATFAAFSDGTLHPPLNAYRRVEAKRSRMQRRLAGIVGQRSPLGVPVDTTRGLTTTGVVMLDLPADFPTHAPGVVPNRSPARAGLPAAARATASVPAVS